MQIARIAYLAGWILLGCSVSSASDDGAVSTPVDGAIPSELANEGVKRGLPTDTADAGTVPALSAPSGVPENGMKVIPRWACVAMCDYALSCGESNIELLRGCMYECDWNSG